MKQSQISRWHRAAFVVLFSSFWIGSRLQAGTLRIVSWNIEDDINGATTPLPGLNTVLQGIGNETVGSDPAHPLDILGLEETTSNATTVAPIVADLNADYAGANYKMTTYQATESGGDTADGNGPNAIVYNANTLTLVASVGVGSPSGSSNGEYRQVARYEFQPIRGSSPFYVYVEHSKSGSTSSDATARKRGDYRSQRRSNFVRNRVGDLHRRSQSVASAH